MRPDISEASLDSVDGVVPDAPTHDLAVPYQPFAGVSTRPERGRSDRCRPVVQLLARRYHFPSRGPVMTDRFPLRVLVFPAEDVDLRGEIQAALANIPADLPESRQIADLEKHLRRWYRSIEIRPRDPLGGYDDDPTRVWYVYRDGRIRARNERLERLYGALAAARLTVHASEEAIGKARTAAEHARYPDRPPVPDAFVATESPPPQPRDEVAAATP
jgi:hypothetical protein